MLQLTLEGNAHATLSVVSLPTSNKHQGFLWAVEQIPQEKQFLQPKPDKWSVARLAYHLVCYDQFIG
jgi:hypothetical protein